MLPAVQVGVAHAAGIFRMHSEQFQSDDLDVESAHSCAFRLESKNV